MAEYIESRCASCHCLKERGMIFYLVRVTLTADFDGYLEDKTEDEIKEEMERAIEKARGCSEEELLNEVYQEFSFYLCKSCRDRYIQNPFSLESNK